MCKSQQIQTFCCKGQHPMYMGANITGKYLSEEQNHLGNQQFAKKQSQKNKSERFQCLKGENNTKIVKLNQQYEIDPDTSDRLLYETIQYLVEMINEKNEKSNQKYHIKDLFGMNLYSSLEFILGKAKMEDQKCMICLKEFQKKEITELQKELSQESDQDIYVLKCSHKYHIECLLGLIGENKWAKCPVCSTIFGNMVGDQPEGKMTVTFEKHSQLPGHPKGVFTIFYNMSGGVRNGKAFQGTTRRAYLPDTPQGREVLQLLQQAFNRKLIFTVGRSVTTGLDNQTVWNGIHHKTSTHGGASHFGYPDETYLDRVREQLAAKGITPDSLKSKH